MVYLSIGESALMGLRAWSSSLVKKCDKWGINDGDVPGQDSRLHALIVLFRDSEIMSSGTLEGDSKRSVPPGTAASSLKYECFNAGNKAIMIFVMKFVTFVRAVQHVRVDGHQ